ncbi:MAG: hypothetical protein OJF55_000725 [Rhodanobacteraceae bacterium]|nr:MAG: hypothetical protein OJF55_000725 [Rhodanobacteraceae bacterium]
MRRVDEVCGPRRAGDAGVRCADLSACVDAVCRNRLTALPFSHGC